MAVTHGYRATMAYQAEITATKLIVEFNGTRYEVPRKASTQSSDNPDFYGAEVLIRNASPLYAPYPFCILREDGVNVVYVNEATNTTPFTLKIIEESLTTTECFEKAVKSISGSKLVVNAVANEEQLYLDKTMEEIYNAVPNVVVNYEGDLYPVVYCGELELILLSTLFQPWNFVASSADSYPVEQTT